MIRFQELNEPVTKRFPTCFTTGRAKRAELRLVMLADRETKAATAEQDSGPLKDLGPPGESDASGKRTLTPLPEETSQQADGQGENAANVD